MEETTVEKESTLSKGLKLFLKIAITVLCFWYISRKIDFTAAKDAFLKANWFYLFIALLLLTISKIFSSFRLNIYFRNIRILLSEWTNIKLYWLGMFYNLFLPGAISGDAYKVILLKRKYDAPYKKTSAAVLLDRFSGLVALGLIMAVYGVIVFDKKLYDVILLGGAFAAVLILYFVIRKYFRDFIPGFWPTFFWGMAVQMTQVVCVYFIMLSLHIPLAQTAWIFIFLAAAIVSVLPISIGGGLGPREFIFQNGAVFFALNANLGVIISLLFYLCTVLSSLPGLFFVFHDPLKNKQGDQ
jgi:uncharacterized membrane protein YbhN (UPF0104 family)